MRLFILFVALMSYQAVAEINTCQPNQTIKMICNAENQIFADITIAENASISQAILEGNIINQGLVSNIQISEQAYFLGGKVSGTVKNKGKMEYFVFVGEKLQGGELAGIIENKSKIKGEFQDIKLAPNTIIRDGIVSGKIEGDKNAPALLDGVIRNKFTNYLFTLEDLLCLMT